MRKLLIATIAMFAMQGAAANATTFDWSISGAFTGSGTLDASNFGPDQFILESITGTLTDASADVYTINPTPNFYDGPDNVIYYPQNLAPPSPPYFFLDLDGISFSVGNGTLSFNVYENNNPKVPGYNCVATSPYCIMGPGNTAAGGGLDANGNPLDLVSAASFSLTVAPTPLPAALPLFATGLGALGLLGWRRKRKSAAAALAVA